MILPIGETKKNNAFTLVEILLVIIITGIILALAAPNFSKGYSRFQLNQTADDLLTMSRWAQATAIGQDKIYTLSFSDDRRSYQLMSAKANDEDNGNIDNSSVQDNFEPVKGTLGRMHQLPNAIGLVNKNNRINFYPDGTIDPAEIQLTSPEEKELLSSSQVRGMMTKVNND